MSQSIVPSSDIVLRRLVNARSRDSQERGYVYVFLTAKCLEALQDCDLVYYVGEATPKAPRFVASFLLDMSYQERLSDGGKYRKRIFNFPDDDLTEREANPGWARAGWPPSSPVENRLIAHGHVNAGFDVGTCKKLCYCEFLKFDWTIREEAEAEGNTEQKAGVRYSLGQPGRAFYFEVARSEGPDRADRTLVNTKAWPEGILQARGYGEFIKTSNVDLEDSRSVDFKGNIIYPTEFPTPEARVVMAKLTNSAMKRVYTQEGIRFWRKAFGQFTGSGSPVPPCPLPRNGRL